MREELVSRNVARLGTLPPDHPARQQPWSPNEALAFLQTARGDRLYPAFVLLLGYDPRRGEVLGLSWRDVDLEHGVLRVRQQLLRAGANFSLVRSRPMLAVVTSRCSGSPRSALLQHAELKVLGAASHEWTARV